MRRLVVPAVLVFAGCSEVTIKPQVEETEPDIFVDPTAIDFGLVGIGDTVERPFSITNAGSADLVMDALTISDGFRFGDDPSGGGGAGTLAPGASVEGTVIYEAVLGPVLYGEVAIPSNDPDEAVATISLKGVPGLPELEITPNPLDFGALEVGTSDAKFITLNNVGTDPIEVTNAVVGEPFWLGEIVAVTIPPGESRELEVHFTPPEPLPYEDLVIFTVTGLGEAPVTVLGSGNSTPTARCEGIPVNPVIPLERVLWKGSDSSDPAGQNLTYHWDLISQPPGSTVALLNPDRADLPNFPPDERGEYVAQLTVTNEQGITSTCEARIEAVGDKPIAQCSVSPNPAEALRDQVRWSGAGSSDPGGTALTYNWTLLSQPAGSSATMPGGPAANSDRAGFVADQAGTYVGRLVVTNAYGVQSDPCDAELEVVPGEDLWVEMFWNQAGEDMDLHLVRDSGSLRTGDDCYYANCTSGRDWGANGADNNPRLDLDDIAGNGPENINIESPENIQYHVWVHDYPGSVRQNATDVTVNVYLGGVLAWTDTKSISNEDTDNLFCTIDWANQTVTP